MGLISAFPGYVASLITSKIPLFFAFSGSTFIILKNHSALSAGAKDLQKVAKQGQTLLKQPYEVRVKIKDFRKRLIDTIYSKTGEIKDPHTYHLASTIRLLAEKTYGTKEEAEKNSVQFVNKTVCSKIRNYEKNLRFKVLSRITDTAVKKISTIASTQAFRLILTNLTGLGLAAILYYVLYYALRFTTYTPHDSCKWHTPLKYTWNRVFPLSSLHKFPETCFLYQNLILMSDLTKWALRLYIWDRMIQEWEKSRVTAVEDFMKPVKKWGKAKWNYITRLISTPVTSILQLVSKQFNDPPTNNQTPRKVTFHLNPAYTVNIEQVRSSNLVKVASHELRRSENRSREASQKA